MPNYKLRYVVILISIIILTFLALQLISTAPEVGPESSGPAKRIEAKQSHSPLY